MEVLCPVCGMVVEIYPIGYMLPLNDPPEALLKTLMVHALFICLQTRNWILVKP